MNLKFQTTPTGIIGESAYVLPEVGYVWDYNTGKSPVNVSCLTNNGDPDKEGTWTMISKNSICMNKSFSILRFQTSKLVLNMK